MSGATRREALKALVGLTSLAVLPSCLPDLSPARFVEVAPTSDGYLYLDLSRAPELAEVGGAVTVTSRNAPAVIVINSGAGLVGLASSCTHAGCPVGFSHGAVICPCHESAFDLTGKPTHPPATKALRRFPIDASPAQLSISLIAGDGTFPTPVNGQLFLPFSQFPDLASAGHAVIGVPATIVDTIAVMALAGGGHATTSAICTHRQCVLDYARSDDDLECNCHGSRFRPDGSVIDGPARQPLKAYPTTASADGLTITLT